MSEPLDARYCQNRNKVADNIFWVGTYLQDLQSSINCYLLIDKKIALIDAGSICEGTTILDNVKKHVDPRKIDYIVITHSCVDHMGGLLSVKSELEHVKVVGHPYLETVLRTHYGLDLDFIPALEGSSLELGEKRLWFMPPVFLDAGDTLYVFEEENKILFSSDTFCNMPKKWTLFAENDISEEIRFLHTVKFPATSLSDKTKLWEVARTLKQLDAKVIATSHGLLIDKNIDACIDTVAEVL